MKEKRSETSAGMKMNKAGSLETVSSINKKWQKPHARIANNNKIYPSHNRVCGKLKGGLPNEKKST